MSCFSTKESEIDQINDVINQVKEKHGCQIVINGVLPTLKYYLRLVSNLEEFITLYSSLIQCDSELKACHKEKWNDLILRLENVL